MSTRFSLASLPIARPGVAIRKRDFGLVKDWKHENLVGVRILLWLSSPAEPD
jgi:hypothetical protein